MKAFNLLLCLMFIGGANGAETLQVKGSSAGKTAVRNVSHTVTLYEAKSGDANFPCNGAVVGWNPVNFTYTIPRYRLVRKAIIQMSGLCDDYCRFFINGQEIGLAYSRGGVTKDDLDLNNWHKADFSGAIAMTMPNQVLTITTGTHNASPKVCYAHIHFTVTLQN